MTGLFVFLATCAMLTAPVADEIVLVTGEHLRGTILAEDDGLIVFQHPVLGRLEIRLDQLQSVLRDGDQTPDQNDLAPSEDEDGRAAVAPDTQSTPTSTELTPAAVQPIPPEPEHHWKIQLELGFNGSQGNTELLDLRVAGRANRDTPDERTRLDSAYYYGTSRGDRRQNRFTAGVVQDWLLPASEWFYFYQGRFDSDEFKAWDYRVSMGGGAGVKVFDSDEHTLTFRLGLGGNREFGSENADVTPEAILGSEYAWQITPAQKFATSSTFYPDVEEPEMYRLVSSADWTIQLDHADGVKLRLGLQNEYESNTGEENRHNDLKFYGALVIDF